MTAVYLDHNATSPLRPEAGEAAWLALSLGANPSSTHGPGRAARAVVEGAREQIADALGAPSEAVVFTSGGAEAVNLAILGAVAAGATRRIIVSAVEHDAVTEAAKASGAAVETAPVDDQGVIDLAWLEARLARWDDADGRPFVALMHANNETGVIEPVADAAKLARAAGGLMLVDAAQTLGKRDVDLGALGASYLAVSAHKLGGPQGAGALILAEDAPCARCVHGGGQERGRRAGTENVAGVAGFAAALEAALRDRDAYDALGAARDAMELRLEAARPDVQVMSKHAARLPHVSAFALKGFASETQVMALDLAGFAVSAGAACSSGKVRASHVLKAMGADDATAGCALRVSLGWTTAREDLERFAAAWLAAAERAAPQRAP